MRKVKAGVVLMGAGRAGNFGNTQGSLLDVWSNFLTAASFIPGIDIFVDLAAMPVDLARGDFVSAGLDLVGVIPFVGEVADAAKVAKLADKAIGTAKVADKVLDAGKAVVKIPKLPKAPTKLKNSGWKETTSTAMKKNTTSQTFRKDGLTIRFDKGKKGLVDMVEKTITIY